MDEQLNTLKMVTKKFENTTFSEKKLTFKELMDNTKDLNQTILQL